MKILHSNHPYRYLRSTAWIVMLVCVVGYPCSGSAGSETSGAWLIADQIEQRIIIPHFPAKEYLISDFGAVADGKTSNTEAIAKAIEACVSNGGGKVIVPPGKYLTGPIHLASNVNLHVAKGATILFDTDPDAYLPVVFTRFEGVECMNYSPLIYAFEAENVAVTGEGVLDGQAGGDNWWAWKGKAEHGWKEGMPNQLAAVERLGKLGEDGVPVEKRIFGAGYYLRPSFIQFYRCRNILIEGVTILRSPMWEVHPVLSTNITVRGLKIMTHGPNNDGCDPESCKDVLIEDCVFDTGDDCIAIKSGRNFDGRRINTPSENIIVRNCVMKDGHGGVVIGSEVSGGCRNVFVEDCLMDSPNLERAIRIKTNSIRGGLVDGVYVRNVEVGQVAESVLKVNYYYGEGAGYGFTPVVQNIFLENVNSRKSRYPLFIAGYEHSPVRNIHISNCRFEGAEEPSVLRFVENLVLDRVIIDSEATKKMWSKMK